MIIWSGWGILVPVFCAFGFFMGIAVGAALEAWINLALGAVLVLGFLFAPPSTSRLAPDVGVPANAAPAVPI